MAKTKNADFYERDGRKYLRVTRVLDYFQPTELVEWKLRVGKREASRVSTIALKSGTAVHEAVEAILNGGVPKKTDSVEVMAATRAFLDWSESYLLDKTGVRQEVTQFCERRMIAGTYDLLVPSMDTLVDLKTSKRISSTYFLQLGAYWSMMPESERPRYLAILVLDKQTAMYDYVRTETDAVPYDAKFFAEKFENLHDLYRLHRRFDELRATPGSVENVNAE